MNNPTPIPPGPAGIPEAAVEERRGISVLWLMPLVAVLIGVWLIYTTISEQGPEITIRFKTAEGLEAGKTQVRYKQVQVGLVDSIRISDDLASVEVTASMDKDAERHLTESTRFWVVRPRISAQGVSGLGTLVSGAYIEVDPGKEGASVRAFTGLEIPPVIQTDEPGKKFVLTSETRGSISPGSPIYFRGVDVGQVLGSELTPDRRGIQIHVFIKSPHHELVRDNSRFWNVSGVRVSLDANGMNVQTQSLQSILVGGIAFQTPPGFTDRPPSKEGTQFTLYETQEDVKAATYTTKHPYIMYFTSSVRGLAVGAPVEFRGIRLGEVTDIRMETDADRGIFRTAVKVEIEPARVTHLREQSDTGSPEKLLRLIKTGLRAQLRTGNLLTGQLFVDLVLQPKTKARLMGGGSGLPEVPTIPSNIEQIRASVMSVVAKIEKLPLERLVNGLADTAEGASKIVNSPDMQKAPRQLTKTMQDLDRLINNLDTEVAVEATKTLREAHATLASIHSAISDKSTLRYNLETTLEELAAAAQSIKNLAQMLERNPNALITGKAGIGGGR